MAAKRPLGSRAKPPAGPIPVGGWAWQAAIGFPVAGGVEPGPALGWAPSAATAGASASGDAAAVAAISATTMAVPAARAARRRTVMRVVNTMLVSFRARLSVAQWFAPAAHHGSVAAWRKRWAASLAAETRPP